MDLGAGPRLVQGKCRCRAQASIGIYSSGTVGLRPGPTSSLRRHCATISCTSSLLPSGGVGKKGKLHNFLMPQAPPTQHRDANGNANGNGDGLGVDRACLSHSPASFRLRRNSRPPPGLALPDYHHYQGAKRGRDLPVLEFNSRVGVNILHPRLANRAV